MQFFFLSAWNDREGESGRGNWRPRGGRGKQYDNQRPQSESGNKNTVCNSYVDMLRYNTNASNFYRDLGVLAMHHSSAAC